MALPLDMRARWIGLFVLLIALRATADPYLLFNEKGKIGIKDQAGNVVIPAFFEALGWSDGSFSIVGQVTGYKLKDRWGLINLKKEFLSGADYESLTYPGGDRVVARRKINPVETKTGCLNLKGEETIPFRYDGIQIQGLRAVVFTKTGATYAYGLVDLSGHEILPVNFKNIYSLGTLRYAVENRNGKTALFSEQGKPITGFTIDSLSAFRNNVAVIYSGVSEGLIDRNGEIKADARFSAIRVDAGGTVWAREPDHWKILSAKNEELKNVEADDLTPWGADCYHITKGNRHGIVDRNFNILTPLDFSDLQRVPGGNLIVARQNKKSGILRPDGSVLFPFQADSLTVDGMLIRMRDNLREGPRWSLYDTFGIKKTTVYYDFIAPRCKKIFPVRKNGYWGAIDRTGEEVIHCVFDSLLEVGDQQVVVRFKGLYGIISLREEWLFPPQEFPVRLVNAERLLRSRNGMVFLEDFSAHIIYFTDNKILCREDYLLETLPDGTQKKITFQGARRDSLPQVFESHVTERPPQAFQEGEGLRSFRKDGKYGFIDDRGRLRIANRYDGIRNFKEGRAAVKILARWGFINVDDQIAIQPAYDWVSDFSHGHALVKRAGKYGVIDGDGKLRLLLRYDSILTLANGNFQLILDHHQGLADPNGQLLIDPKYDDVQDLDNGYILIRRNGKFGVLMDHGLSTIPLVYDALTFDREKNQYLGHLRSDWKKLSVN
jgi:hypothetical protein